MKRGAAGRAAMLAKGRLKRGQLNDTEKAYAAYLDEQQRAGLVVWWLAHGIKLALTDAGGAFYVPDFAVMLADGTLEIHEVKGHWEGDAKLKIRVAADRFPFQFRAVMVVPKSRGGGWQSVDFTGDDAPLLPGTRDKADVPAPVKRGAPALSAAASPPALPAPVPPRRIRKPRAPEEARLL